NSRLGRPGRSCPRNLANHPNRPQRRRHHRTSRRVTLPQTTRPLHLERRPHDRRLGLTRLPHQHLGRVLHQPPKRQNRGRRRRSQRRIRFYRTPQHRGRRRRQKCYLPIRWHHHRTGHRRNRGTNSFGNRRRTTRIRHETIQQHALRNPRQRSRNRSRGHPRLCRFHQHHHQHPARIGTE